MLSVADVLDARERVAETTRHTPLEYSHTFSAMTGADVHLKLELFQRTGSFKLRGATNRIATLSEAQRENGVVTASAGNHAQGVALAATRGGVDSKIVMPEHAPVSKVKATERYGGEAVLYGADYSEAQAEAHRIERDEGRTYVHAFDDDYVMAGQGTIGLEIYDDLPGVDTVVVPIGGGGLISGVSTAINHLSPETRIVGVQATGAETVHESLDKGFPVTLEEVDTIADGIATGGVSEKTLRMIREHVDEVVTVTDTEIARAILLLMERAKQVVEGSGAASVAAVLSDDLDVGGETVMPLLCGGNLDMTQLRTVLIYALAARKQILRIRVRIDDRPGRLEEISGVIADWDANIHDVRHDRSVDDLDVGEAYLVFDVETSGAEHAADIVDGIAAEGYAVDVVNHRSDA